MTSLLLSLSISVLPQGDSALHLAVQAGNVGTLQVLLTWKADIHERGADGARPYEMAGSQDPVMKALFREALITMPLPEDEDGGGGGGFGGGAKGGGPLGLSGGSADADDHAKRMSQVSAGIKKGGREVRQWISLQQRVLCADPGRAGEGLSRSGPCV